jgi:hypothetical protein
MIIAWMDIIVMEGNIKVHGSPSLEDLGLTLALPNRSCEAPFRPRFVRLASTLNAPMSINQPVIYARSIHYGTILCTTRRDH